MHNNNSIVPYISLCSGYEGIGLGLHHCIPNLRCIGYCEREAFSISNLVAKMENGLLDAAPVFTDVTTFPWGDYAPFMAEGILSFGWPCQPVSTAGKRKATEDERWLFDIIADGISILRPGMLFAENVEGLLSARMPDGSSVFGHCIERLESLHYKVAAGIFSASEVGAVHQRKRVFIMAHRKDERFQFWKTQRWGVTNRSERTEIWDQSIGQGGVSGEELANSSDEGLQGREWFWQAGAQGSSSGHITECSSSMADTNSRRMSGSRNELGNAGEVGQGWENTSQNGIIGNAMADTTNWRSEGLHDWNTKPENALPCCAWPSRPGQPQYAWEPPRVVGTIPAKLANFCAGNSQQGGNTAQAGGEGTCERGQGEDAMPHGGSSLCGGDQGDEPPRVVGNAKCRRRSSGNVNRKTTKDIGTGCINGNEAMGNAECIRIPTSREHGAMDEASGIPADRERSESPQADPESSSARKREDSWSNASECSEIKPEVGRNIDGTTYGVDISELSGLSNSELAEIREWMVKGDNRTDELRSCGNGVVPATAERAFRVLMEELINK